MSDTPTTPTAERLYSLLPAVHRLRDAEQGHPLRELVTLLAEQVDVLTEDLDQLYDDQFVETAAGWVVPYIGDLVGNRPLPPVGDATTTRAEVANTIAYRRRKGTASVLEQLARDVTGWPARVVEYFERLTTTQYMNHVRPAATATADLRAGEALGFVGAVGGAFDDLAHTADVRRIGAPADGARGRHNIPNVGVFLFRTAAVRVTRQPLTPRTTTDRRRFRFDPLGADQPLFGRPRPEPDISHLAEPFDVPLPLGRRWTSTHLGEVWGADRSLLLELRDATGVVSPVAVAAVRVCDLSDVGGADVWAHVPPAGTVAVDPVLGRVVLGTPLEDDEALLGTHHVGEAVPVGASARTRGDLPVDGASVAAGGGSLQPHLDGVAAGGTLRLTDSERFSGAPTFRVTTAAGALTVRANDHQRPHLAATGPVRLDLAPDSTLTVDGLLVSGGPLVLDEVGDNQRRTVVLRSCTLVPGQTRTADGEAGRPERASLLVLDPFADVTVERCVVGPVVAVDGATVRIVDSVVDASDREAVACCGREPPPGGGPRTVAVVADQEVGDGTVAAGHVELERSTVVGGVHATTLSASNSILLATLDAGDPRAAPVLAERRQVGCVRFTFLDESSRTGERHRCQPDPDDPPSVQAATRPHFTSLRFGDPGYAQLRASTPVAVARGADDEGEMGVTHLLHTPQRTANLAERLDEYLRFGLEAGAFHAT